MKQIKITAENDDIINDAISAAEGPRAKVNTLDAVEVAAIAEAAEKRLESLGIPKKDRAGATLYFQPEGPSASSYKYPQGATTVRIARRSGGWYVDSIVRDSVFPKSPERRELKLTAQQDMLAVIALRRGYTIAASL